MIRCYSYAFIRERIFIRDSINALPYDGVTVTPKNVGAVLM